MTSVHKSCYGENDGEELFLKNGATTTFTGEIWAIDPHYEEGDDEPSHTRQIVYDDVEFYGKLEGLEGNFDEDELEKMLMPESFQRLKNWAEEQEANLPNE